MNRLLICVLVFVLLSGPCAAMGEGESTVSEGKGFGLLIEHLNFSSDELTEPIPEASTSAPEEASPFGSIIEQLNLSFAEDVLEAQEFAGQAPTEAGMDAEIDHPNNGQGDSEPEQALLESAPETGSGTALVSENDLKPVDIGITINGVDWKDSDDLKLYASQDNLIQWQADGEVERFFAFVTDTEGHSIAIASDTTEMTVPGSLMQSETEYFVIVGYQPVGGVMEDTQYNLVRIACV